MAETPGFGSGVSCSGAAGEGQRRAEVYGFRKHLTSCQELQTRDGGRAVAALPKGRGSGSAAGSPPHEGSPGAPQNPSGLGSVAFPALSLIESEVQELHHAVSSVLWNALRFSPFPPQKKAR